MAHSGVEEGTSPPSLPPQTARRSPIAFRQWGWCSPSCPAERRGLWGSWEHGGLLHVEGLSVQSPGRSQPTQFMLLSGCLSPGSPPLVTAATAPLQNYLRPYSFRLWLLGKNSQPHTLLLEPALGFTDGPRSLPHPQAGWLPASAPGSAVSRAPSRGAWPSHPQPVSPGILKCTGISVFSGMPRPADQETRL